MEVFNDADPLIRNALLEILFVIRHAADTTSPLQTAAQKQLGFHESMVPEYWEAPELSADFRRDLARLRRLKSRAGSGAAAHVAAVSADAVAPGTVSFDCTPFDAISTPPAGHLRRIGARWPCSS